MDLISEELKKYLDLILTVLEKYLVENPYENLKITLGEALILTIDACAKANLSNLFLDKLYVEGVRSEEDKNFVSTLSSLFEKKKYSISSEVNDINEEGSRRYFESHLALNILTSYAGMLKDEDLTYVLSNLTSHFCSLPTADFEKLNMIRCGNFLSDKLDLYEKEYAELLHRLGKKDYYSLSPEACSKLALLTEITIISTLITQNDPKLPVAIFDNVLFDSGWIGKGRVLKDNKEVRTTLRGLMKSTNPIPYFADSANPVLSYEQDKYFKHRSVDQANPFEHSQWGQIIFAQKIHPFSNGISTTTLAFIRNLLVQKRKGKPYFANDLPLYLTIFACLMLYNSGGHSFFEIFSIFQLPVCKELFSTSPINTHNLIYDWLCKTRYQEYQKALKSTQIYCVRQVLKKKLHLELLKKKGDKVLNPPVYEKQIFLEDSDYYRDKYVSYSRSLVFGTGLMFACFTGDLQTTKELIEKGVDPNNHPGTLSPLNLAVISQKLEIVDYLLKNNASIDEYYERGAKLEKHIPSLISAVKLWQNTDILVNVLNYWPSKKKFLPDDIWTIFMVALNHENVAAIPILFQHLKKMRQIDEGDLDDLVHNLVKKTVKKGNIDLFNSVVNLNPMAEISFSDAYILLELIAETDYLPLAKCILTKYREKTRETFKECDYSYFQQVLVDSMLWLAYEKKFYPMVLFYLFEGADQRILGYYPDNEQDFQAKIPEILTSFSYFKQEEYNLKKESLHFLTSPPFKHNNKYTSFTPKRKLEGCNFFSRKKQLIESGVATKIEPINSYSCTS